MLENFPSVEFDHPLILVTAIGLSSLIYCEIADILNGNKYPLFCLFERDERENLSIVLAEELVSPEIKRLAQDRLDSIAYRYATGIAAEKIIQEKIIDCYHSAQGRLDYSNFKKALAFLQVDLEGKLKVKKISWLDSIAQFYWFVLIGATLVYTYYLFSNLIILQLPSSRQIHLILVITLHVVMIFGFIFRASILNSARKIANEMEKGRFKSNSDFTRKKNE